MHAPGAFCCFLNKDNEGLRLLGTQVPLLPCCSWVLDGDWLCLAGICQ